MRISFAALRGKDYAYWIFGSTISSLGAWVERFSQAWLVLQLTGNSAVALGITTALQYIPHIFLSGIGGRLADKYKKVGIVFLAQIIQAFLILVLGLGVIFEYISIHLVYIISFLFGCATAIEAPARSAIVSDLVGEKLVGNAVIINSISYSGARLVGPAIAGVLIYSFGIGAALLISLVPYVVMLVVIRKISINNNFRSAQNLDEGRYFYILSRNNRLLAALVVIFFISCFGFKFQMTTALMSAEVYQKGAGVYSAMGIMLALGALIFAITATAIRTIRLHHILFSGVVFGFIEAISGLMPNLWSFFVILPILGFFSSAVFTLANSYVQTSVSYEYRGRVMAMYSFVNLGASPIGAPVIGFIGDHLGARYMLISGGLFSLIGILISLGILLRNRNLPAHFQ